MKNLNSEKKKKQYEEYVSRVTPKHSLPVNMMRAFLVGGAICMPVSYTHLDHILTDEIMKCLETTEGPDYVYTISVQGHGDYSTEPLLTDPRITVTGAENREKNNYSWEYYVNQIYEMDQFVQELVDTLAEYDEPTVLVMYGDHLPTMGLEVKDVENRYLFQTQYVIWDNIGLERRVENLSAYQMAAEVMNRLDIHEGQIFNYHQTRRKTRNYQVDLEALQYDMLYGERYVFGGDNPYIATDMQLGTVPVFFDGLQEVQPGTWYVTGENFTASSYLEVNGELADTTLISPTTLLVNNLTLEEGDEICVAQQSNSSTHRVLSRTLTQVYHAPAVVPEGADPSLPDETEGADPSLPAETEGTNIQ